MKAVKSIKSSTIELYGKIGTFDVFTINEDILREMLKKSDVKVNAKIILSGLGFSDGQLLYTAFSSFAKTKIKFFETKKDLTVSEILKIIQKMNNDAKILENFFFNSLEDKNCILSGSADNKIWKIKNPVFRFDNSGRVVNNEIKIAHSAYHSYVYRDVLLLSKRDPDEVIKQGSLFMCL